ncbi:hypothetical protein Plhal304r1_c005g0021841 [Plasmopara halstedii]
MNSTTVSIEVGCEEVEIKLITSAVFLIYGCVQCMLSALQYILSFKHKRLDS